MLVWLVPWWEKELTNWLWLQGKSTWTIEQNLRFLFVALVKKRNFIHLERTKRIGRSFSINQQNHIELFAKFIDYRASLLSRFLLKTFRQRSFMMSSNNCSNLRKRTEQNKVSSRSTENRRKREEKTTNARMKRNFRHRR